MTICKTRPPRRQRSFSGLFALAVSMLLALPLAFSLSACSGIERPEDPGFKNTLDSVVKIDVWEESHEDGGSKIVRSIGSGVIMDDSGMILTNAHVVNPYATKIVVTLVNLERVKAEFIGWDHWTDLAVIKLDTDDLKNRNLTFKHARFGDSSMLRAGDVVYAVGTPHGYARTVTRGIVSNTSRFFEGTILDSGYETGNFNTWIQTDAAINPGNSGGPLVLPNGDVVSINTRAHMDSNNLGFSVPSNVAKKVMAELVKSGKVSRSYTGISLSPLQEMEEFFDIDTNLGVLVRNVDPGSPAANAKIFPGDIILSINGKPVDGRFPEQLPDIMNTLASITPNSEINLTIMRNGEQTTKKLSCENLESRIGKEYTLEKWGVGMQDMTKVLARESKVNCTSNLLVIGIRNGYPFDAAGIEGGDIIVSINRKPVSNSDQLRKAYEELSGQKILVEVERNHVRSFHIVNPRAE